MKHLLQALLVSALIITNTLPAWADTTNSDTVQKLIDEEAMHYVNALENSQGEALITLGVTLQDSGITDERVLSTAEKIAIRLHKSYNSDKTNKNAYTAATSLARFLAGSGSWDYSRTLNQFVSESKSRSLRNLSKTLISRISWYESRNKIMNDFSNHMPEHNLSVTRYLNLLDHQDRSYGRYAVESMTRQNWRDPVLISRVAELVKENYKSPGAGNNLDAIAWYIRVLGRDEENKYQELLQEISDYGGLHKKLRKHVRKALRGQ